MAHEMSESSTGMTRLGSRRERESLNIKRKEQQMRKSLLLSLMSIAGFSPVAQALKY